MSRAPRQAAHSRKLELEKLADGVIDSSTPHTRDDHRSERIIHDDDIGSSFGHLRTSDTHRETNIGKLECCSIIRAITRGCDGLAQLFVSLDEESLVFW
jgi:hypothetical protein